MATRSVSWFGTLALAVPGAGRIAGLDSGTLNGGPVDEALAALADALGRPAAASAHRRPPRTSGPRSRRP